MVTIGRERGVRIPLRDDLAAFVTVHPSYLLRLPDEAAKREQYEAFRADLACVKETVRATAERR